MRFMQDEQPIEYHVIKWQNSAFHNHDTVGKRKMLGGVSFDGGVLGNNGGKAAASQAGVQEAQPSFPNMNNDNVSLSGIGLSLGGAGGKEGIEKGKENADKIQDSKYADHVREDAMLLTAKNTSWNNIITSVIGMGNTKIKRFQVVKDLAHRFVNGMSTLLSKSRQNTNKQDGQNKKRKPVSKPLSGTRAITKEDVYEIQVNSSYLLESYNKNGERSTLGKQ